ncbi:hypothetical protein [Propionibacterium australiense]|uniref:Uncharacterized protein n=1 Tax=Propionibacterium australiense TaxID=119981 RepID=A0A383S6F9_9ACTN|nr:hypothetical protein [Propionibacterium australiense]RLP07029.1 hypothetical protein D7U36_11625 [Propionibacterium australiense]RLP07065.1 hypothetical protein D9T14_10645 [Propionibacterium australiense]SYZ33142.1 Hypothetical protein PROPAUS_1057 [Propionibacterium australiense]VEH89158.1 Uncharacterised protein [Propionibacterium australiense]
MAGLIIICLGLFLPGTARLAGWLRHPGRVRPVWLSATRAVTEVIAWYTGAALILLIPVGSAGTLRHMLLVCLCATAITLGSARLLRMAQTDGGTRIRSLPSRWVRRTAGRARATLRHGNRIIAPTGWGELNIGPRSLGRLLEPQTLVRAHLVGLLLVPVLVATFLAWAVNSRPNLTRATLGAGIGYNGLAIASCLTTALILTALFMTILTYSRTLTVGLDLRASVRAVAEGTGFGTAAGLLTAALVPAAAFLLTIEEGHSASLTPRLLVDIPAAYAIIGFTVGLFASLTRMCRKAQNLVIRRLVCPLVFVVFLTSMTHIGFSPANILRTLASGISDKEIPDCSVETFQAHSQDPLWLLKGLNTCQEGGAYIQDDQFLWSAGIMIGLIALGAFVLDIRTRARSEVAGQAPADHGAD